MRALSALTATHAHPQDGPVHDHIYVLLRTRLDSSRPSKPHLFHLLPSTGRTDPAAPASPRPLPAPPSQRDAPRRSATPSPSARSRCARPKPALTPAISPSPPVNPERHENPSCRAPPHPLHPRPWLAFTPLWSHPPAGRARPSRTNLSAHASAISLPAPLRKRAAPCQSTVTPAPSRSLSATTLTDRPQMAGCWRTAPALAPAPAAPHAALASPRPLSARSRWRAVPPTVPRQLA
jgi:hypothetical protein